MSEVIRNVSQWAAISQAINAGPNDLTVDMYQNAVVAQVVTDMPELWPLGSIEGLSPVVYMANGAREEYEETLQRDQLNPGYHRLAKLGLPRDTVYAFEDESSAARHLKEFGDLSWYVANILASHHIRLSEILPDPQVRVVDELARSQDGMTWHLPGHNYIFHAKNFLAALGEMHQPLNPGDVGQFAKRRQLLGKRAAGLLVSISVVAQAKFGASLAEVLYSNLKKVERRVSTGTVLNASGDEREKIVA